MLLISTIPYLQLRLFIIRLVFINSNMYIKKTRLSDLRLFYLELNSKVFFKDFRSFINII